MIENLSLLAPDPARRARTLARCHDQLAVRRRRLEARNRAPSPRALPTHAERLIVLGLCVVYLVSMAGDLLTIALS